MVQEEQQLVLFSFVLLLGTLIRGGGRGVVVMVANAGVVATAVGVGAVATATEAGVVATAAGAMAGSSRTSLEVLVLLDPDEEFSDGSRAPIYTSEEWSHVDNSDGDSDNVDCGDGDGDGEVYSTGGLCDEVEGSCCSLRDTVGCSSWSC